MSFSRDFWTGRRVCMMWKGGCGWKGMVADGRCRFEYTEKSPLSDPHQQIPTSKYRVESVASALRNKQEELVKVLQLGKSMEQSTNLLSTNLSPTNKGNMYMQSIGTIRFFPLAKGKALMSSVWSGEDEVQHLPLLSFSSIQCYLHLCRLSFLTVPLFPLLPPVPP